MKRILTFVFIGWAWQSVIAQRVENSLIENLTEIISENSEEEPDTEELIEIWQFYLDNPIDINSDCTDNLRQLRFLSEFQIESIEKFKSENGAVLSIYELLSVDGFSRELLENLQAFLIFGKGSEISGSHRRARSELFLRSQRIAEKAKGYKNGGSYLGQPEKYYLRYKRTSDRLNFGITAEKDPGEVFFRSPNKGGFDYYSVFANFDVNKGKHRIYAGDFIARAGQGLVIWQGFASGKSAEVSQIYRSNQGIRSYSSADENRFLRGLAGEIKFRDASIFVFHSRKKIDANLEELDGKTVFTSFQTSGFHRTAAEIADKNSVTEDISGLLFAFQKKNISVGLTAVHTFFDKPKMLEGKAYQLYLFEGDKSTNTGFNYKWSAKKIFLFGETAYSINGGLANLHGVMLKPADRLELSMLYRNFGKKYNCLYGQAFSESSAINDEQGFYIGAKLFPVAKITISAYHDFFRYQWLKYQTVSPSLGSETLIHVNYFPIPSMKISFRYFMEQKEGRIKNNQLFYSATHSSQKGRLNLEIEINEQWSIRSRAEYSVYSDSEKKQGLLLLQDLKYKSGVLPFSFQMRFAWFDTESYNCRLYAYENDLLYNFSIPALSGKGVRSYFNAKYSLSSSVDFWIKLARTQYFNQNSIGTGLEEIIGDQKTELKFQMRYRF